MQENKKESEKSAQSSANQAASLKAQIEAIKSNKELLNALKADAEISANLSELKSSYEVEINRYGDIHFKKAMLQSLKHFSSLNACEKLQMQFEKDCIKISRKAA